LAESSDDVSAPGIEDGAGRWISDERGGMRLQILVRDMSGLIVLL